MTTGNSTTMHSIFVLALAYSLSAVSANVEDIPEECRSLTYCTVKAKSYPQEMFNMMYDNSVPYLIEPSPTNTTTNKTISVDGRDGIPAQDDNCAVNIMVEPLYYIREDLDKPWRTVVQAPSINYVQTMRLEICVNPNGQCFKEFVEDNEFVLERFRPYCNQEYIYYNLVVLKDEGSTETETARAKLPVCCSCRYEDLRH